MTSTHDPDQPPIAEPLRPTAAVERLQATPTPVDEPAVPVGTRTTGPSKLRVGVVSGAAMALAVGAVATSFAATPTQRATMTTPAAAAVLAPAVALDPVVDTGTELGLGRFGARGGFGEITISAISGSSLTLTTADGWTRTIAVGGDVELTKGGQEIAIGDLAVGDQVRFAQTRNDDGTYTVTAIVVVVPSVAGTISDLTDTSFKVTTRDGSVWTITTDGSTAYQFGAAEGTRADLENGIVARIQGEATGDNALRATSVQVAGDRVAGTVTARTADTITITTRDGTSVTVHVTAETEFRIRGVEDADLDDVTVDMTIGVSGRERSDGSIDAGVVTNGREGRGFKGDGAGFGRGFGRGFGPGDHGPEDAPAATPTPAPTQGS
jgi:hypothetical protein